MGAQVSPGCCGKRKLPSPPFSSACVYALGEDGLLYVQPIEAATGHTGAPWHCVADVGDRHQSIAIDGCWLYGLTRKFGLERQLLAGATPDGWQSLEAHGRVTCIAANGGILYGIGASGQGRGDQVHRLTGDAWECVSKGHCRTIAIHDGVIYVIGVDDKANSPWVWHQPLPDLAPWSKWGKSFPAGSCRESLVVLGGGTTALGICEGDFVRLEVKAGEAPQWSREPQPGIPCKVIALTASCFEAAGRPKSPPRGDPAVAGHPKSPSRGEPAAKKDPLSNPLRIKIRASSCVRCGRFDPEQGGRSSRAGCSFLCGRCLSEKAEDDSALKLAYCSLVYGKSTKYVSGALALGCSLQRSGTSYDCVLLHTADVPAEALAALKEFWRLQPVEYVAAAPDLHRGKFEDVFTKLQALNPAAMPYDRVVFLDLDVLVRTNIDELFELRPPAAMSNQKTKDGIAAAVPEHGARMAPRVCSINAGTMVLAPSQALFDALVEDVQACDAVWHRAAWSPEQSYLSTVMAGEWSHVDQSFNFEVQLHGGTPCSYDWENAKTSTIAIAHFSGSKPWDQGSTLDITAVRNKWSAEMFSNFSAEVQEHVTFRCKELHEEWHNVLSEALQHLSKRGINCRSFYRPSNGRAPA